MHRGRFITFEGGEGTGKTTLIAGLKSHLETAGISVTVTREPGGTPRAEKLRELLLSMDSLRDPMCAETEALIVCAARSDHVENQIRPLLAKGKWVLCDRFTDSTQAYQGRSISSQYLQTLNQIATRGLTPDLTFLLDADPEELVDRRIERGLPTDRFEGQSMQFHQNIRQSFLKIARDESERVVVIDAMNDVAAVLRNALEILLSRFEGDLSRQSGTGSVGQVQ